MYKINYDVILIMFEVIEMTKESKSRMCYILKESLDKVVSDIVYR